MIKTGSIILKFWVPVIAWGALISASSSIPGKYLEPLHASAIAPIAHFSEYFILGILLIRAFMAMPLNFSLTKLVILSIIITSLYGGIDEWHQHFVPQRCPDVLDFLVDSIGAAAGILLYIKIV